MSRTATAQPARRVARWFSFALLSLLLLSLAAVDSRAASRSQRLKKAQVQFEQAERLRADLDGTPEDKRHPKEYLRAVYLYRRVYDLAPFHSLAATALANAAEIYHDMGKQFDPKYWHKAIETYQFLRKEYPHSRYQDDALFNIAQVYHVHLDQPQKARDIYQQFLRIYPRSRYAATARDRLKNIEAELAAAREPSPPARTVSSRKTSGGIVEVRNVRYWNAENYTRVVMDLDGPVEYKGARIANPDRIFFDLYGTRLSTILSGKTFEVAAGLLNRIRVAENRQGVTRVVMEVKNAENYSFFSLPNPFRLVVDIRGPSAADVQYARKPPQQQSKPESTAAEASSAKEKESAPTEVASAPPPQPPTVPRPTGKGNHTLSRALGLKVGRIVIDPGHGGHDTGTIGPTGLMEKDLVLDVARRLGRKLEEALNAEVIYTREDDSFVPLENRIALANEKQADLFISIHANSSRDRKVRGVETFYLNFSSDPEVLELAARENALSQKSVHELQDLVRTISRNEKLDESRELADTIQKHLHSELRKSSQTIRNRGVKRAPFVVLIGGNMPSILTEVAFLSNPSDEKLLKAPKGRQVVADGIYAGMTRYLEDVNSVAFLTNGSGPSTDD